MDGVMSDFLSTVIAESESPMTGLFTNFVEQVMYLERYVAAVLGSGALGKIYTFIYIFFCSLLVLKALQKGFGTYILWRDGDADTSPIEMIVSIVLAMGTAAAFPVLYPYLADTTIWFSENIVNVLIGAAPGEVSGTVGIDKVYEGIKLAGSGFTVLATAAAYLITLVMFWLQIIRRAVEMMILRVGFPIACVGLLDSDSGIFKPYVKLFWQAAFTTALQVACFYFSLLMMGQGNVFFALGAMLAALKGPTLMNSILINTGGGGGVGQAVSTSHHALNLIKTLRGFGG